ncbi:MAG: PH domain-containing protein [Candidatus Pacebacteria bacterium]|nr:PH domain-containing protein [Candidatus Paceibacterota bacterium]
MQRALPQNIRLQPEEKVLLVVRKHWFIHFMDSIGIVVIGIIPFIFVTFVAPFVSVHAAVPAFFTAMWLLAIWMMLFTVWTNYYLDIWIVTDKRIINIDQIHLFKRDISTLRIERVQDIKVEMHGIFATIFGFGNLQIQTAGPVASFYLIKGIPNPSYVRNAILERIDLTTEHKDKFEYNKDQRPSESE